MLWKFFCMVAMPSMLINWLDFWYLNSIEVSHQGLIPNLYYLINKIYKLFFLAFSYVNLVYRGKEWFALVSILAR